MGATVGIDLGTTYSAVAVLRPTGEPEILANSDGDETTPSVVMFQDVGGTDEPLVGAVAKHAAAASPDDVAEFVKRRMGDPTWRFESPTGASYTAEEVSAILLRRLKADAELALGETVTDAVITVPAYFDDARRKATMDAGRIAGLNVLRVLNEPTAAALSFGLDTQATGTALVFDLGGGTFDITVMRLGNGAFEVLGTDGDRNLGGFDFDNALMVHIAREVQAQGGPDLLEDGLATAALREKAELAKRSLTTVAQTVVVVTAGGKTHRVKVTRDGFENLTRHLLRRTEDLTVSVLDEAGLTWPDIDHVLLVGGSTRMPMVRSLVEGMAGRTADRSVHPDLAVALGAAIQAAVEKSSRNGTDHGVLVPGGGPLVIEDVTSQSLGTLALDGDTGREANFVIIPRNTKVPAKESDVFHTVSADQPHLRITVTEGDDTNPEYVVVIGEQTLPIPPYPKGAPIKVTYAYDIDQMVFVEVEDLTARRSLGTFEVLRTANLSDSELRAAERRMTRLNVT